MPMYDYTPPKVDDAFTMVASAAINAAQLVSVTGAGTVGPSAGADRPIGVAAETCAAGYPVTVWPLPGFQHEVLVKNTSVLVAGSPVISAASGQIDTASLATSAAAGTLIGIALAAGTGDGVTVKVRFIGL